MTIKIKQILNTSNITTKDGKTLTKTQFLTEDNQVMETFAKVEAGQSYEGEVTENQYGKLFKKNKENKPFGGAKSDPDTMLIAYSKDITVAFINAGVIKEPKEAAKQIQNFSKVFFELYDKRKSGEQVIEKKEEPKPEPVKEPIEEEINVDEIPF